MTGALGTPFSTYRVQVPEAWADYNGHMHDASYVIALSDANEELFTALGLSADYRVETGASFYTVEYHVHYRAECAVGEPLRAETLLVDADPKRIRLLTDLVRADATVAATGESLYLHVDARAGGVRPLTEERFAPVAATLAAHADVAGDPLGASMSRIETPYEGSGHRLWDPAAVIEAPLRLHHTTVRPEWVDYNAHLTESCYLLVIGDSADAFFRYVGIDEDYRSAGHSLFTVQTHLHHRAEAREGEPLELSLQLLDHDDRRLHLYHEMRRGSGGELLAAAEQLLVHVDTLAGRSVPLPPDLLDHVSAVHRAHAGLARPDLVGRPLAIRHATPGQPTPDRPTPDQR